MDVPAPHALGEPFRQVGATGGHVFRRGTPHGYEGLEVLDLSRTLPRYGPLPALGHGPFPNIQAVGPAAAPLDLRPDLPSEILRHLLPLDNLLR